MCFPFTDDIGQASATKRQPLIAVAPQFFLLLGILLLSGRVLPRNVDGTWNND
jgi:hypothetical protein